MDTSLIRLRCRNRTCISWWHDQELTAITCVLQILIALDEYTSRSECEGLDRAKCFCTCHNHSVSIGRMYVSSKHRCSNDAWMIPTCEGGVNTWYIIDMPQLGLRCLLLTLFARQDQVQGVLLLFLQWREGSRFSCVFSLWHWVQSYTCDFVLIPIDWKDLLINKMNCSNH